MLSATIRLCTPSTSPRLLDHLQPGNSNPHTAVQMDAHFAVYLQNPNPLSRACAKNGRIKSEMAGGDRRGAYAHNAAAPKHRATIHRRPDTLEEGRHPILLMPQGVPLGHRPRGGRHLLVMNHDPRSMIMDSVSCSLMKTNRRVCDVPRFSKPNF